MLKVITIISGFAVASMSSVAFSNVDEVKIAQDQISQYKALRRACAVTRGEQRKECFSELNAATDSYKRAKRLLQVQKPINTENYTLLGQAE